MIHVWGSQLYIDSLAEDCDSSNALAMELLQSYSKPSIYHHLL